MCKEKNLIYADNNSIISKTNPIFKGFQKDLDVDASGFYLLKKLMYFE
jgi:hypothetical protein